MKQRAILPALMISLLLSACGGAAAETRLEQQRDALAEAEEISFTARVTANLGTEVFSCLLSCVSTAEETVVEALEPREVAGVRARMGAEGAALEYDGVSLPLGGEAGGPMAVPPLLVSALKRGHVIRAWTERDGALLAAELYADDAHGLTVWYDAATLAPVRASLSLDGTETAAVSIAEFSWK